MVEYCKRLYYSLPGKPQNTVLGIITSEDDRFIRFRSGSKGYCFHKDTVIAIVDTKIPFEEDDAYQ